MCQHALKTQPNIHFNYSFYPPGSETPLSKLMGLGYYAAWFVGGWIALIGFLLAVLVVDVIMDRLSYPKGNAPTPKGVLLFDQSFMLYENAMCALEWMLDNTRKLGKTWSFKVRNRE